MSAWTSVVGWTLIHFVWQGAVVAALAAAALHVCRRRSANVRDAVACAALAAMLASPLVTARALRTADPVIALAERPSRANSVDTIVGAAPSGWTYGADFSMHTMWADIESWLPVIVFARTNSYTSGDTITS